MSESPRSRPLCIWRFTDGKRGHENQSLGLIEALAQLTECHVETIQIKSGWPCIFSWLAGRFTPGKALPRPDLIVGAGHATHWPMLAARRAHGGKLAVLMRPSLPLDWFDWVIAPEHDFAQASHPHPGPPPSRGRESHGQPPRSRERGKVMLTVGALNRIRPSANKNQHAGLMLIGGASAEYGWNEVALLKQIHLIALHHADIHWQLTTSRRTPASFIINLSRLGLPNITAFGHDKVSPDWLPSRLSSAAQVWVTPDSASMVYESLSSGAAVGCFDLPYANPGRVARGVEKLVADKTISGFSDWQAAGNLRPNPTPPNEAERCAKELLQCLLH